jgi:hypothetical protein
MIQTLLTPYTANGIAFAMALALCVVIAFTTSRVIATVPAGTLGIAPATVHAIEKESYYGVVSWVTRNSIEIIDSYGVSRVFSIDDSSTILKESISKAPQKYSDVHVFDHVRIMVLKDGMDIKAQTIEVQ